jgi:hypothetical protein
MLADRRSFEDLSAARPRLPDLKPALGLRRLTDPRTPALLLRAPMRLRPGRRFLNPMDRGGPESRPNPLARMSTAPKQEGCRYSMPVGRWRKVHVSYGLAPRQSPL